MSVSVFKVFQSTRPQFIEEVFYLGLWLVVRTWLWIQHMSEQVQENLLKIVFTFEKISFSFYLFLFSFPFNHYLSFLFVSYCLSLSFSLSLFSIYLLNTLPIPSYFSFHLSYFFQYSFRVSFLVSFPFHKLFTFLNLSSSLTFLHPFFFL